MIGPSTLKWIDTFKKRIVDLNYIPTKMQVADILMKALHLPNFEETHIRNLTWSVFREPLGSAQNIELSSK